MEIKDIRLCRNTIRGLDPELYLEACVAAKRAHMTIGQWLNQIIKNELDTLR